MVLKNVKREQISCQVKKIILSEIKANIGSFFFIWHSLDLPLIHFLIVDQSNGLKYVKSANIFFHI